ncbi:MAG TPA: DUF5696 domain-containing protein [Bacteroidales bacterium]|nr:DUF5696 domain-containing protein [Bacteroidales bacterium]
MMKRRNFLKSSIVAAAGMSACKNPGNNIPAPGYVEYRNEYAVEQKVTLLKELQNEHIKVEIFSNAFFRVEELMNGHKWESWPLAIQDKSIVEAGDVWLNTNRSLTGEYPGRFAGVIDGAGIRFTLLALNNLVVGKFFCEISLDGPWLIFKTGDIDDSIPSLVFPPPLKSDAIVIPKGVGEIYRDKEESSMFSRYIYPFYTRLNMRFMGGTSGDSSWIGIFDEGFEDSFGFVANRTATPILTRTLNKWSHNYTWRMQFIKGDYVAIAKTFRKWVIENGKFVSLNEKINANKYLNSLLGGRAFWINLAFPSDNIRKNEDLYASDNRSEGDKEVNSVKVLFTYRQLKEMIERLKKLGLNKGLIKIGGWINGGYDYSHPDVWPPEPALGDISELKEILAPNGPVLTCLHDNNQDMYDHTASFPGGVNHNADGSLLTGGIWAGGQAFILNSRNSLEYAKRNWENIKTLAPKAMFVDIITAMQLYQSFDPENRLTKKEDIEAKIELMKFYKHQGILLGSEESADFGIPYLDWFENRHQRTRGRSVPLWPLVFHDAVFNTRYGGVSRNADYPGYLEDMLWGYMAHFSINPEWNQEELFRSLSHVDEWHERIGTAEMTNHRFLSDDFEVEETTFSTGDRIICNFSGKHFNFEGKSIGAKSYLIVS